MTQNHGDHTHEWDQGLTAEARPVSLASMHGREVSHLVEELDGYLCELAGAQIRDGLHIFGQVPEGEKLVELLFALTQTAQLMSPASGPRSARFMVSLSTICSTGSANDWTPCQAPHAKEPPGSVTRPVGRS